MAISLTQRQADVLRFVAGFTEAKGFGPSYAQIADAVCGGNKTSVATCIDQLEERGAVRRLPRRQRSLRVLVAVPLPRDPQGTPLQFVRAGETA